MFPSSIKQIKIKSLNIFGTFFTSYRQQFSLVPILLCFNIHTHCQTYNALESDIIELQNTNITDNAHFSNVLANPALQTNAKKIECGLLLKNNYGIGSYNDMLLLSQLRVNSTTSATYSIMYTGIENYYVLRTGIGISKSIFKHTKLGIQIAYSHLFSDELGAWNIVSPNVGITSHIAPKVTIGISMHSPFSFTDSKENYTIKAGLKYEHNTFLSIYIQADKHENSKTIAKLGCVCKLSKPIVLFLGAENSNTPIISTLTYTIKRFETHIGLTYHDNLGLSPHLGVNKKF